MASKTRLYVIGTLIALAIAAGPVAVADYFLPHHAILRIVGAETRRPFGTTKRDPTTHDVFYVFAEDIDTHKPWVFQNEDTGFGLPFYFKFNSADVQAVAQSLAGERGTALITYYGWRIQLFSVVPNIISIKRVDPDSSLPFPFVYVGFWGVILGGGFWLFWRFRRFFGKGAAKV
ncbi:MAG TPA: DUF1523 family protein [Methylocella sp.]|nr:DUF1523 family protein [Methylocella sp.]